MIRTITRTVLALAAVAAILPVSASAAEAVRLGAHAPQTGALATHGIEQIKGIRLGAEDFEKAHPGVKVQLFVYDDESTPQKAVAAVEKLAGIEKVNAIVGGYGSNLVGPASEVSERYDVPYMTTGAVDTKLTAKKFKNFFRLNYMPGYASAQSGAMKEVLGAKKVAVLYNSQSATTEIAEVVRE
jgi:branched-chain amino acid transport system substrate-binding protein